MSEPGTDLKVGEHELVVHEAMAAVYRRNGRSLEAVDVRTPLDALIAQESGQDDDEYMAQIEAVRKWLGWMFEGGPHPDRVMQRVYACARACAPELLLGMSGAEIALLFDQTRAAESARMRSLVNGKLQAAGYKSPHLPYQKSESSVAKMRQSAKGNTNRRNGKRRSA
jgi:hypothetical protein